MNQKIDWVNHIFEFVVVLIGILICFCLVLIGACGNKISKSIQSTPFENNLQPYTIPFELTAYNNIKIKVRLNGVDSLDLKFDSGTTGLLLTHEAIAEKTTLLADGKETRPTQNYVKLKKLAFLEIGALRWDSLEVYPVRHTGQGTDGRFGWDLFAGKIVELDYDKSLMKIHHQMPKLEGFTTAKMNRVKTLFCLDGQIVIDQKEYPGPFLFDTGYQRALLLDSILMQEQNFPNDLSVIKVNRLTNGAGKVFITKVVEVPSLALAGQEANQIPTQLLNTHNPAGFKTHILGNELLKRYNTFLDFKDWQIFLKENSLIALPYSDAS